MKFLSLSVLPHSLAICQLQPGERIPDQVYAADFWSITRTQTEISLVVPENLAAPSWKTSLPWRALKVAGPLDFTLVGILASLSTTLANAGISIFAISTFDTDYLLVKAADLEKTVKVLSAQGHLVIS